MSDPMTTKPDWTRAQALRWRRERDEARQERDIAAADADRRSCQGGWRLAQERAVRAIAAESAAARLRDLVRVAITELSSPELSEQHLRELVDDAVAAFSAALDEDQRPFVVVKMLSGTWNVRDDRTGEWERAGVGLTKPDAQCLADRLNRAASREEDADRA